VKGGGVASSGSKSENYIHSLKLIKSWLIILTYYYYYSSSTVSFASLDWFYESCDRFHSKPFCEQDEGVWAPVRSEPAPTSAPWRMNDKWPGNNFLLGSSSVPNHGGELSYFFSFFTHLLTTHKQVVNR
jgi:hypothetical protein